ncbi:MAG: hypothetical protein HUJ25_05560, partial [Crocinitomicaceae bacterium]|nr:hypothetical protein [Crocinitomicaceae bacterium]
MTFIKKTLLCTLLVFIPILSQAMPGGGGCNAAGNVSCGSTTPNCNDPAFNAGSGGSVDCTTATQISMPGCLSCISGTTANSQDGTTTTYPPCGDADGMVWFTFIANEATNNFTLTPGTLQDPLLVISDQPCGSGTFNTCASGTGSNAISDSWALTPGQQAWIGVGSTSETEGTFDLCVESVAPVPGAGNTCSQATVICETDGFSVPMECATGSGTTPSCFFSAPQQDTWITFTILQSGTLEWTGSPDANAEYDWALWDITGGCPGSEVECNYNYAGECGDDFGMGTAGGEFNGSINVTAGEVYAIQIDNFSGNGVGFNFVWDGTAVITPEAGFTMSDSVSCTGSLFVNFTHTGIGPATYDFGNGNTYTGSNPPSQTYNAPGTYAITATASAAGCTDVYSSFVTVYDPLVGTVASTPSLCNPPCDGSAYVSSVSGGDGVNSYLWNTGSTSDSITGLCPGNYDVTITSQICGSINLPVVVGQTDVLPPTASNPAGVSVECIADVPLPNPAVVTDEADDVTIVPIVTHLSDVSDGNTCPETITRTYRVTDTCGNFTDVAQTITVDDITPPTGTAPADILVMCVGDVPAADPLL